MITFFRSFFQSKLGITITLGFLALIAFAFASSDVANTGTFGGVSGGDRVAVVGDRKISTSELSGAATSAVNNIRLQNPTISMAAFLEEGGLEDVLAQLLERAAISEFAQKYGLRAGTNLVNSEIMRTDAFKGADGNFSEDAYRQILAQQSLSDKIVRDDFASGLLARQLLIPAAFGGKVPDKFALRYASLIKERRQGGIAVVPASAFAPKNDPTKEQLNKFYEQTKGDYIRPERRILRYVTFGDEALDTLTPPTKAEIAARYQEARESYAASESRTVTQLIVPTEQAAKSIRDRVLAGGSLETAAREAGLETVSIGPATQSQLTSQTSAAVARASFAANRGAIAAPARSGLGFHVVRIDRIEKKTGKNLEQASAEIATALTEEKRREALSDLAEKIEREVETGVSLTDIAKDLKLETQTTKPVTGAGQVYEAADERVPDILAPALQTAFQMETAEPQLAEIIPGQTFLVYEVTSITKSAPAPLSEINDRVVAAWKLTEGSKLAEKAVERIMKRMAAGASLAAALREEKVTIPAPDAINLSREQLGEGTQVPAPLALLFSMAEGTTKRLEAPRNAGWFIVRLDEIEEGKIAKDDPQFAQAKAELNQSVAREYSDQLRAAVEAEMGVERNEAAIAAVRKQLTGAN